MNKANMLTRDTDRNAANKVTRCPAPSERPQYFDSREEQILAPFQLPAFPNAVDCGHQVGLV